MEESEIWGHDLHLLPAPQTLSFTHLLPFDSNSSFGPGRPHVSLEVTKTISTSPRPHHNPHDLQGPPGRPYDLDLNSVTGRLHSLQTYLLSFGSGTSRSLKTNGTETAWPSLGIAVLQPGSGRGYTGLEVTELSLHSEVTETPLRAGQGLRGARDLYGSHGVTGSQPGVGSRFIAQGASQRAGSEPAQVPRLWRQWLPG